MSTFLLISVIALTLSLNYYLKKKNMKKLLVVAVMAFALIAGSVSINADNKCQSKCEKAKTECVKAKDCKDKKSCATCTKDCKKAKCADSKCDKSKCKKDAKCKQAKKDCKKAKQCKKSCEKK